MEWRDDNPETYERLRFLSEVGILVAPKGKGRSNSDWRITSFGWQLQQEYRRGMASAIEFKDVWMKEDLATAKKKAKELCERWSLEWEGP